MARRVGAVTHTTIDLNKGVAEAELVIVCTPVGQIVEHVRQAAQHCPERTLITDAGSTKQSIVEALDGGLARGCRFLGSHPLAGSEKAGAAYASADLFEGRVAILTPTKNTRAEDFDLLEEFWQSLGSVVVQMTPEEHDQALAMTSHLPHVAAAALALTRAREVLPPVRHGHARHDPRRRRRSGALAADSGAQSRQRADGAGAIRGEAGRPARRHPRLTRANRGEAEIAAAMEETSLGITPLITKRIPALFPLANIATLIGLIGTISGLIKSFSALSAASPEMKSQILAIGISEAMYNTAFGLMIAVVCMTAQLVLGLKAKGMQEELEYNASRLENLLSRRAAGDTESDKAA